MSKSTALLLSVTIVSSLLLAACQPQSSTITPEPTPMTEEKMVPTGTEESSVPEGDTMTKDESMTTETSSDSMSLAEGKKVSTIAKYQSPAGEEQVGFTLVVDDAGVIVDGKTDVLGKAPTSILRQEAFSKEFVTAVKGKKLKDLNKVDRIGGSSLTTGAFNKALTELKSQV